MYKFYLDDQASSDYNLYAVRRPSIPAPSKRFKEYEVPGRDGKLYIDQNTYEDIEIPLELNYISNENEWFSDWRKAKKWLIAPGMRKLQFSDDHDFFHIVKRIELGINERTSRNIGRFQVTFITDPYEYDITGSYKHAYESVLYNPYETCHPVYIIQGEGVCDLIINGKKIIANVGQNLTIDTGLQIAYRSDHTLNNIAVSGNYQDMYLEPGINEIQITDGFILEVIPNWRCI